MKKINNNKLYDIDGGFSLSGTLVNAFSNIINRIHSVGQSFGSALRRLSSKKICKV